MGEADPTPPDAYEGGEEALPAGEEQRLWRGVAKGEKEAREQLVRHYLPFAEALLVLFLLGGLEALDLAVRRVVEVVERVLCGLDDALDHFSNDGLARRIEPEDGGRALVQGT